MKNVILAVAMSLPMTTMAGMFADSTPVCVSLTHLEQANEAKKRNDTRGMGYLVEEGYCFYAKSGTEYSVIDVNYPESPTEWAKIRVYTDKGATELFTWYGFVQ